MNRKLGRGDTMPTLRRMAGVTLLELMAVVVIIGILGIIAVPSYRQYTVRAHRTEAKTALLQLSTNQERFYLQNHRYGSAAELEAAGFLAPGDKTENGTYVLTVPVANATTYTATATPVSGAAIDQTQDTDCTSFSIDAAGVRTAVPDNPNSPCW